MLLVAMTIGLFATTLSYGWVYGVSYSTSYVVPEPVVVEHVYTPPVVAYEPQVVTRTSTIGNDWFSVSSTRSYVDYEPVVEAPVYHQTTVIYDRPHVVARSYSIGCPTVVVPHHRTYFVGAPYYHHDRAAVVVGRPHHSRRIKIKYDD